MEENKIIIDVEESEQVEQTNEPVDVEKLMEELNEIKDKYIRVCADYTNHKKRAIQEKRESEIFSTANILKAFLPILDGLDQASYDSSNVESLIEGFEMINRQLKETFEKIGVEEVGVPGEEFDSKYYEALNTIKTDEVEPGKITKVYLKGYKYKDKVIRQSMVEVAK